MYREVNHAAAHTVYVDNRSVFDRMVRLVDRGANFGVVSDRAKPEIGEDARQRVEIQVECPPSTSPGGLNITADGSSAATSNVWGLSLSMIAVAGLSTVILFV